MAEKTKIKIASPARPAQIAAPAKPESAVKIKIAAPAGAGKIQIAAPAKSGSAVRILAIRLRGGCSMRQEMEDTLQMLGLKRRYSGAVLEPSEAIMGMVRKIQSFVAWGEATAETSAAIEKSRAIARQKQGYSFGLKPPVGGLKSIKLDWPRGDLGYRGAAINELVKRML